MELHYHIVFKDGSTESDADFIEDGISIEEFVALCRSGRTGMDIDNIDYMTFSDNDGNEY